MVTTGTRNFLLSMSTLLKLDSHTKWLKSRSYVTKTRLMPVRWHIITQHCVKFGIHETFTTGIHIFSHFGHTQQSKVRYIQINKLQLNIILLKLADKFYHDIRLADFQKNRGIICLKV